MRPEQWIHPTPKGLYVAPGDFYIDPVAPVARAVITHGHADHARPNHGAVLATAETGAIMRVRYRDGAYGRFQALAHGEEVTMGGVTVRLVPAGHVLGSAQVVLDHAGSRVVVSGDYKRDPDPNCPPFEPVPCDVFITEATFGLPVFRLPPPGQEMDKLLASMALFPDRAHVIGCYNLGKAQRIAGLLRQAGFDGPIWLHGGMVELFGLHREFGRDLGDWRAVQAGPARGQAREDLKGAVVIAPPSAIADRWSRRLPDPVVAMASGWMRVRQRAKQRGVELPLVISDHADWDDLTRTIAEVDPAEVWVTHGREEALCRHCALEGRRARALSMVGYEDETED